MKNIMHGTVIETKGSPHHNSYRIKGEDNKTYFAHIGDIEECEALLYKHTENFLHKGDKVRFEILDPAPHKHVMHVKKL